MAEDGLENTESGERANERPEPDDIIRPLRWYCCAIAYPASEPRGITGKRVIGMWVHGARAQLSCALTRTDCVSLTLRPG